MKNKLKNAFNKIETPNNLNEILNDCSKKTGYVYIEKSNKNNYWYKGLAYALAAVLLITTLGLNMISNQTITTIAFDVNPSIELEINKNEEIVKVIALNEHANIVIEGMDLEGVDLDIAVNALIGSMVKHGYLNELANSILVTVNSDNEETNKRLQNKLTLEINEFIKDNQLDGAVLTQSLDSNSEIEELSTKYNITKSKAQLIQKILKINNLHTFDDLVHLSINELNLIIENQKDKLDIQSSGQASDKKYIGKDQALAIVLNHAKLESSDIQNLEIDMDVEDNILVYEVEFEWNGKEYEYEIDSLSGKFKNIENDSHLSFDDEDDEDDEDEDDEDDEDEDDDDDEDDEDDDD